MNARALPSANIGRRAFLGGALASCVAAQWRPAGAAEKAPTTPPNGKWRAAIIGKAGHGDYGHELDLVFTDRPNIEVLAVADPDESGRAKAVKRSGAMRHYADPLEMLEKEKPQLVCLASRWSKERHALGRAALAAGAHLITEKPFTTTLAEADDLLGAAERSGAKIAVAHQMRLAPSVVHLHKHISDGAIGDLLEMRAWGKQDGRAGGEDMLVLGSHLFDLLRLFAGDAQWCTARVLHQGRDIARSDARNVKEQIGPVAGDEITAQFAFANGVHGSFTSRNRLRPVVGHWGIEFIGSKGAMRLLANVYPSVYAHKAGTWSSTNRTDEWTRWEGDPSRDLNAEERGFVPANRRVVDDWLAAIQANREPICSGRNAMKSIEMIMAVYQAALSGRRVPFPLQNRAHPLIA